MNSGAPLGFSIDGFVNFVLLQKAALKTAEILKIFPYSHKLMGSRIFFTKLMGSMEPIEPMLTEPLLC